MPTSDRIRERPLTRVVFPALADFRPQPGTAYLYSESPEERTQATPSWMTAAKDVQFVRITEVPAEDDELVRVEQEDSEFTVSLNSAPSLSRVVRGLEKPTLYLDMTGMPHHVWAPLLRAGMDSGCSVRVVYIEPRDYRRSLAPPTEEAIFDLSEAITGIRPLPSFANILQVPDSEVTFVPLLGFEGGRFLYVMGALEPPGRKVIPVIGVPGFRADYPFHTWLGNATALRNTNSWLDVEYADAACPFTVFNLLQDIQDTHQSDLVKVAPIGTKPHALGAVLYAIAFPDRVELVYDHPLRKASRTLGTDRVHVYFVTRFLDLSRRA